MYLSRMRIGIDYRPALDARGGIGVYVRELAVALREHAPEDDLELFGHRLRRPAAPAPADVPEGARLHRRRLPAAVLDLAGHLGFGADRMLGDVDVLHATDYVPLASTRAPLVATIHDVCFHTLPEAYDPDLRARLASVTDELVACAARVIVPCARVRKELLAHTAASADRVRVVPHGPPRLAARADAAPVVDGPYVLCVATVQPRKNLTRLLDAFRLVRARHGDVALVVVGGLGWGSADVASRLRAEAGVHWLEAAERDTVATCYRDARVVAYPSLGEGFGFPVLEAWTSGVPVLVGRDTAAADVGADAALAVDPYDVDAIVAGLTRLLEDATLRARLVAAGTQRRAGYGWARTAAATRAVYAEAAAS